MPNQPLTKPDIDYSGLHQANQFIAQAGAAYGQALQEGLTRLGAGAGAGIARSKERKLQLKIHQDNLAKAEEHDLRVLRMQQAHLDAENTRLAVQVHNKRADQLREEMDAYSAQNLPIPPELRTQYDSIVKDASQAMARLTLKTAGSMAEVGGAVAPGAKPKTPT